MILLNITISIQLVHVIFRLKVFVNKEFITFNKKMAKYYFKINVREGAPGWADDDWYTSEPFNTFGEAYRALFYFKPQRI